MALLYIHFLGRKQPLICSIPEWNPSMKIIFNAHCRIYLNILFYILFVSYYTFCFSLWSNNTFNPSTMATSKMITLYNQETWHAKSVIVLVFVHPNLTKGGNVCIYSTPNIWICIYVIFVLGFQHTYTLNTKLEKTWHASRQKHYKPLICEVSWQSYISKN